MKKSRITPKVYNMKEEKIIFKAIADKHVKSGKFIFDKDNSAVFTNLIRYLNGDPNFEKDGFSLYKGLLIAGNIGSGKSILMKIIKEYCFLRQLDHQFRIVFSDNIPDKFARHGYDGINLYTENSHLNNYGVYTSNPINLCIDDLGVEKETVKHFGSEETVIEKVLVSRYNLFQEGYITHVTTNLDAKMLRNKYGDRIYSRMKEMFNFIVLPGEDRRR